MRHEDERETNESASTAGTRLSGSQPMPGAGIDPDSAGGRNDGGPAGGDFAEPGPALVSRDEIVRGSYFEGQVWHRPYAEALLETDPERLRALIAEAERAILTRYLELSVSPQQWDESFDLEDAVGALSQLKKAIARFAAE